MEGIVCDACGDGLLLDSDARYIVKVEGYAAYDVLEVTRQDLERDFESETRDLLASLEQLSGDDAQDEVYRRFQYDLCPKCWARYLKDPLAGIRRGNTSKGQE